MARRSLLVAACALLLLAAAGCGDDDGGDAATTSSTSAPTTGTTQPTDPRGATDRVTVRPVLSSAPCDAGGASEPSAPETSADETTVPETTVPETTVPDPGSGEGEAVPDRDGMLCYTLGPPGLDGGDLTGGTATNQGGEWTVTAQVAETATEEAEALFGACYDGADTCPAGEGGHGYVAVMWEGVVVAAPAVQTDDVGASGLRIAGRFTEPEANELADILAG